MLTQDQKTKYLTYPHQCPYCGSEDLSSGKTTADTTRAVQNVSCRQCKKRWSNIYTLAQIEEDEWDMKRREVRPRLSSKGA